MKPFDGNGVFRPAAEQGGLRRLAVRGAGATVFSSGLALGVQMVATLVLARLLRPADFGVVAMVTTFSLLLVNFGLNGFTEVILQWEAMDHSLASNLFWINIGAGLFLTVLFAASGSLMARFYGDSQVTRVAAGVSVGIFLTSTAVIHLALLKRAMRFTDASINDIISRTAAVGTSVLLAWAGWGYWALVAGTVAQPLSQGIGAWILCRWMPGLPRRGRGTGAAIRFAMNIYGRFTVNYCARNMDNLLVGWRFGPGPLGFYKKAYDLFLLSASQLISPLTNVAVSALSRLDRGSIQYRRYLLGALGVTAFVGMGLGADLTLIGKDVIRLMLGPGWDTAGRIFMFFGPGVGIMLLYGTHGWIHLSIGTADRWFRWVFAEFAVTGSLFLLALRWGPEGIAVAWTVSFWILAIPAFWYAGKPIGLGITPVFAAVWKFIAASLLAGCASAAIIRPIWGLNAASSALGAFEHIVMTSLLFAILYLGAVILLHRGLGPIHQVLGLLKEMSPLRKFSKPAPAATATVVTDASQALASQPEELQIR